jgi:hypothetical protein
MCALTCVKFIGEVPNAEILLIALTRSSITFVVFFCLCVVIGIIIKYQVPQLAYLFVDREVELIKPKPVPEVEEEIEVPKVPEVPEIEKEKKVEEKKPPAEIVEKKVVEEAEEEKIPYGPEDAEQIAAAIKTLMSRDEEEMIEEKKQEEEKEEEKKEG